MHTHHERCLIRANRPCAPIITRASSRQADRAVVMLEMLVLAIVGIGGLAWLIVLLASSRANSEARASPPPA